MVGLDGLVTETCFILQSYFQQSNYNKMLRGILVARKTMDHFSIFRIRILLLKEKFGII